MGLYVNIKAYSGKDNPEFKKHFNAVAFCIENELSFPKETEDFFRGKLEGGHSLGEFTNETTLESLKEGITIPLKIDRSGFDHVYKIKVTDIPKEAEEIIITLDS